MGCIQRWHGIEKGRKLTGEEIGFLVDLIMGWIEGEEKKALQTRSNPDKGYQGRKWLIRWLEIGWTKSKLVDDLVDEITRNRFW